MPPRKGEIVKLGPKGGMKYYQVVNSLYLENENIKAKEGGAICYVQEVSEEVAERQLGG